MCSELHFFPLGASIFRDLIAHFSMAYIISARWLPGCISQGSPRARGRGLGYILTTLFTSTEIKTAAPIDASAPRKKLGWLPLLTVLFCLSYGLMTMLIVEQGSTIESQRALIHELFRDSTELSANKFKAKQDQIRSQASKAQTPQTQNPSTQAQAPSSQAAPQHRAQNQKPKEQFEVPSRPASDLNDARRALVRI